MTDKPEKTPLNDAAAKARRAAGRHQKTVEALDRCVALWGTRIAEGGWNGSLDGHGGDRIAVQASIRSVGLNPLKDVHSLLSVVLDRCERLLNLIADQPVGLRGSLSASGVLMDVNAWLVSVVVSAGRLGVDGADARGRAFLLWATVESHPVWPTALVLNRPAADIDPVFARILCEARSTVASDSPDSDDVRLAFQRSLRHGLETRFRGVSAWQQAQFVSDVANGKGALNRLDETHRRIDWLVGAEETLPALAMMLYGCESADAARSEALLNLLSADTCRDAIRRVVDLSDDQVVGAVAAMHPGLLENECALVRVQRAALLGRASAGRTPGRGLL